MSERLNDPTMKIRREMNKKENELLELIRSSTFHSPDTDGKKEKLKNELLELNMRLEEEYKKAGLI